MAQRADVMLAGSINIQNCPPDGEVNSTFVICGTTANPSGAPVKGTITDSNGNVTDGTKLTSVPLSCTSCTWAIRFDGLVSCQHYTITIYPDGWDAPPQYCQVHCM